MSKKRISPIHPGDMIKIEFLKPLGISQKKLAESSGINKKKIKQIIHGKRRISGTDAIRLGLVLSTSPELWINLQSQYDLQTAKIKHKKSHFKGIKPLIKQSPKVSDFLD